MVVKMWPLSRILWLSFKDSNTYIFTFHYFFSKTEEDEGLTATPDDQSKSNTVKSDAQVTCR